MVNISLQFRLYFFSQDTEEVQALMCLLYSGHGVYKPGEVVRDVNSKKFKSITDFHAVSIYDDRLMVNSALPKVQDQFFSFVCVE